MNVKIRELVIGPEDSQSAKAFFDALTSVENMGEFDALDMFARTGDLTVRNYMHKVKYVDMWELMGEHEESLQLIAKEKGCGEVCIGDSYKLAEEKIAQGKKYDLIVIDSPQGLHTDYTGVPMCEHFNALSIVSSLAKNTCWVVLYVNKSPYNKNIQGSHGYDEYANYSYGKWMDWRKAFYGAPLITEEQAMRVYRSTMAGYKATQFVLVPCLSDVPGKEPYAFRLGIKYEKLWD